MAFRKLKDTAQLKTIKTTKNNLGNDKNSKNKH